MTAVRSRGLTVALPSGPTEVPALADDAAHPWAALALAHGAGAGMEHPFLQGVAEALVAAGVSVLRFTFPYRAAGRRMPGPAAHATATWRAAMTVLAEENPDVPQFSAGKSYGGRMASMAAADGVIAPAGLVYLGYPLHPPGAPDKLRVAHLPDVRAPQLFVSGTVDPFVQPIAQLEDAVASCGDGTLLWIPGGGHSFDVKGVRRGADEVGADVAASLIPWLRARA